MLNILKLIYLSIRFVYVPKVPNYQIMSIIIFVNLCLNIRTVYWGNQFEVLIYFIVQQDESFKVLKHCRNMKFIFKHIVFSFSDRTTNRLNLITPTERPEQLFLILVLSAAGQWKHPSDCQGNEQPGRAIPIICKLWRHSILVLRLFK